jgi:FAD dependent oxidoreductase
LEHDDESTAMDTFAYARQIPVDSSYDVLVAGGGPAGTAAAVCAARLGARVLLAESTGCLGGMGTSGLVTTFGPMADGKETLVGGFTRELIETLYARGFLGPDVIPDYWTKHLNHWIPFKPEGLKRLLDEFAVNAGVDVRFFTRVIDADVEGRKVRGAIISGVDGQRYVRAKAFIDATGDATLADRCGAACVVALRDSDTVAPSTLCSLYAGIDWNDPAYGAGFQGTDEMKLKVRKVILPKAIADGHFSQEDRFMPGMNKIGQTLGALNGGHVFGLNGLDSRSLSEGMIFGRKLALEYTEFFRKYVPGCANIEHVTTAPVMGVRDTRRIVGEFELTITDFLSRRQFPDQVAVYNRPTDNHPTNTSKEEYERFVRDFEKEGKLGAGDFVGIPYGILVPRGWENLWVAGRCHSSDSKVHGSIRAQSAAYLMGEAVATAAKQSIDTGQPACDLDTARLVETLRAKGGRLPQATLSKTMTRSSASSAAPAMAPA